MDDNTTKTDQELPGWVHALIIIALCLVVALVVMIVNQGETVSRADQRLLDRAKHEEMIVDTMNDARYFVQYEWAETSPICYALFDFEGAITVTSVPCAEIDLEKVQPLDYNRKY